MSRIYLPPYLWVPPLGWEDPLEEGMATHSNIHSCLENPMYRGARQDTVQGVAKSQTWLSDFTFLFLAQLLHWFAIFLRAVKSRHFAPEAVYSLYHSLSSPTFPAFWLLAHSLLHWPPCHSWTHHNLHFPTSLRTCRLYAWNESIPTPPSSHMSSSSFLSKISAQSSSYQRSWPLPLCYSQYFLPNVISVSLFIYLNISCCLHQNVTHVIESRDGDSLATAISRVLRTALGM